MNLRALYFSKLAKCPLTFLADIAGGHLGLLGLRLGGLGWGLVLVLVLCALIRDCDCE
jgi:hypothetical protein